MCVLLAHRSWRKPVRVERIQRKERLGRMFVSQDGDLCVCVKSVVGWRVGGDLLVSELSSHMPYNMAKKFLKKSPQHGLALSL